MHKLKNKKLLSLYIAGFITIAGLNINISYAEEENNKSQEIVESEIGSEDSDSTLGQEENVESEENKEITEIGIEEINTENIGKNVSTKGTITKIEENKIYISDNINEGIVYLRDIVSSDLNIGDSITVIGNVYKIDGTDLISILVDNISNITVISKEDISKEEITTNNPSSQTGAKPSGNSDKISSQSKPSSSLNKPSSSSKTEESSESIVSNAVGGKAPIIIENDLTDSQWESVKSALENSKIKVKDLPNNKIRITKVSVEAGDTIWIVNDPRNLDSEEESVRSIGIDIVDSIVYTDYDVSYDTWEGVVEKVTSGDAKIKLLSDNNIKVIYTNSNKEDVTTTINKLQN